MSLVCQTKLKQKASMTNVKGEISGLRQFLETEGPLKMIKNGFYLTLKKFYLFSRYLNFVLEKSFSYYILLTTQI